ncbi:MAG: dihydrofolate reductase family protein [Anaeromyxobacteraceae bacterium]
MARPRSLAFLGTSLDGFIAGPDDELDWLERGGVPVEDNGFGEFFASVDALLVGRRTWEVVSRFPMWPYGDKPLFVLTRRPAQGSHGERFVDGAPAGILAALGDQGFRRVYVDGGRVVSQFLAVGLLDELTVSILPVVIGRGIRLFDDAGPERWLDLVSSRVFGSGMVQLRYAARRPSP